MPLIEVEDAVLAALRDNGVKFGDKTAASASAAEARAAVDKLLAGPDRLEFLKLYKKTYPDAAVPELDAAKPVLDKVDAIAKEFSEYKASVEKEKEDRETARRERTAHDTVSKGRTWLRQEKKLAQEAVDDVEKLMQEEGIPNYAVAFNHWKASQPPDPEQLPSSVVNRSLDWFKVSEEQPDHKKMLEDPMGWRRNQIHKILTEERQKTAA